METKVSGLTHKRDFCSLRGIDTLALKDQRVGRRAVEQPGAGEALPLFDVG